MSKSEDALGLARRALEHYRNNSTDQAPDIMRMPVDAYIDPQRYQHEINTIFKRLPLALAMTLELPEAGSYVAVRMAGVPVLMVRGDDGKVRAFLNACRHRGAPIVEDGSGHRARFTCPYHAWVYDQRGGLERMYGEHTFGDVDQGALGLEVLPCEENYGFVWVSLTPGATFDVDKWLGDFGAELLSLDLANWHLYTQRDLPGPGWKVTWDGYLEAYHHNTLHANTVGKYTVGNLLLQDTFGPHQLITFARRSIAELDKTPQSAWKPAEHVRLIHSVFPNLSISGVVGDHCLVSVLYPGSDPFSTLTRQTVLSAKIPTLEQEIKASEAFSQMVLSAVRDEDYDMGFRIQRGLPARHDRAFVFGRNEPAVQHYHRAVAQFAASDSS